MIGGEHLTSQGIQKSLDTHGTRLCFQMMLRAVLSPYNRLTLKRPVPTLHKSAKVFTLARSFTVTRYMGSSRMFINTKHEWSVVSSFHRHNDPTVLLLLIVFLYYIMVVKSGQRYNPRIFHKHKSNLDEWNHSVLSS